MFHRQFQSVEGTYGESSSQASGTHDQRALFARERRRAADIGPVVEPARVRGMNTTCLVLAWLILSGCAASRHQTPALDARRLDADVQRLMAREKVQGLAVAVIDGGKVVHVAAYGHRNVARGLPLTRDTLMYGASLTKAAFAYLLLQLVDEGRLDLDA